MPSIVDIYDHPSLSSPTLIVGLEGWIDAGMAAATAASTIVESSKAEVIASFDTDVLIDYRARRPIMTLDEGLEPDRCWKEFTRVGVGLALSLDVTQVIGLGAYPAPVPHTRPTRLALTTASRAISERMIGYVRGSLEVPAGVFGALEQSFDAFGTDAFCLWAQVPHYASNLPYPAGSLALIEGLNTITKLGFSTADLVQSSKDNRERLDDLISSNPDHESLVRQLESFNDAEQQIPPQGEVDFSSLPSGDELAAELQEFLRQTDGGVEDGEA